MIGANEPLATRCWSEDEEPTSVFTQGKLTMLRLEPTHAMLRSERSTHKAALPLLFIYLWH